MTTAASPEPPDSSSIFTPLRSEDPRHLGPYRLLGVLGSGGMGTVYLGRTPDRENVAVKVVRLDLTGEHEFRERFAREVDAARRVDGSHTAELVYADPHARQPWMATTFVLGPSLREAITEAGPLDGDTLRGLGLALAEGLTTIHVAGLVHRDLKPGNILLTAGGPRIIDFGIARALEATALTSVSQVLGTASYMSPEQVRGLEAGTPSDIFSLGCLLAYAATGNPPFGSGTAESVAYRVVHTSPDLDGLPHPVKALIHDCLAKNPADRPTAGQVVERITTRAPRPVTWRTTPALDAMIAARAQAVHDLDNRADPEPAESESAPVGPPARDRKLSGAYKALAAALAGIVLPIGAWMLYDRLVNPPAPDVVADGWYSMMGEPLDPAPDPEHWVEIVISAAEPDQEVLIGYAATVVTSGVGGAAGQSNGQGKETQQIGNKEGFLVRTPWHGKVPVDDDVLAVGVTSTGEGELSCSIAVDQETVVTATESGQVSCVTPFEGENALGKHIESGGERPSVAPTNMLAGESDGDPDSTATANATEGFDATRGPSDSESLLPPKGTSSGTGEDGGTAPEGGSPDSDSTSQISPTAESGTGTEGETGTEGDSSGNGNSGNNSGKNGCNGKGTGNPHCTYEEDSGADGSPVAVSGGIPPARAVPQSAVNRGRKVGARSTSRRKSVPSEAGS